MKDIALLLTCHNRKVKTLAALQSVKEAAAHFKESADLNLSIFLTDDGCTDGTAEAVLKEHPETQIIQGTGELFWAEGMRVAWEAAVESPTSFDAYLLINDDTEMLPNMFNLLFELHEHSMKVDKKPGVYVGPTKDKASGETTYSGALITNTFLYKQARILPNGKPQRAHIGNANIMLVPAEVVNRIGVMRKGFAHGMGDYDYSYLAHKNDFPVYIASDYCGYCEYDHDNYYDKFTTLSFKKRKEYIHSPLGLDFKSHLKFNKAFFPWRIPVMLFAMYFKLYFPNAYVWTYRLR